MMHQIENLDHHLIEMNRYCNDFYDGDRIIFCKIDHVMRDFFSLSQSKKKCVMIIANGDITFNEQMLKFCPENVKHLFVTNTTCISEKVTPLPIGVEMEIPAKRIGHGEINQGIFEKLPYLLNKLKVEMPEENQTNCLYANFNINTNLNFREKIKRISLENPHINFEFGISYHDFVKQVKSHLGTLSPRGNGIECIRTYEVLYLGSIPIVIGDINDYRSIYSSIYKNLPIVFIDNPKNLDDFKFIENQINKVKNNSRESLDYNYWKELISKKIKQIL